MTEIRSLRCRLPLCVASRNFPLSTAPLHWSCPRHEGVVASGLEYDAIDLGEPGSEARLYDGVEYVVVARVQRVRVRFRGLYRVQGLKAWSHRFDGEDGDFLEVAFDAISDIHAT